MAIANSGVADLTSWRVASSATPVAPRNLPRKTNPRNQFTCTRIRCTGRINMTPDTKEWRSSSTYDYWDDADVDALAWECLRRNQKYQRDYADISKAPLTADTETEAIGNRWGLRFPGPAKP
ncbi:DUF6499 domain-containing protein [Altererythrobacter sp. N1]|nr:DUF6499 domain-containing protein [Altererythrobacter sp. N1]